MKLTTLVLLTLSLALLPLLALAQTTQSATQPAVVVPVAGPAVPAVTDADGLPAAPTFDQLKAAYLNLKDTIKNRPAHPTKAWLALVIGAGLALLIALFSFPLPYIGAVFKKIPVEYRAKVVAILGGVAGGLTALGLGANLETWVPLLLSGFVAVGAHQVVSPSVPPPCPPAASGTGDKPAAPVAEA